MCPGCPCSAIPLLLSPAAFVVLIAKEGCSIRRPHSRRPLVAIDDEGSVHLDLHRSTHPLLRTSLSPGLMLSTVFAGCAHTELSIYPTVAAPELSHRSLSDFPTVPTDLYTHTTNQKKTRSKAAISHFVLGPKTCSCVVPTRSASPVCVRRTT